MTFVSLSILYCQTICHFWRLEKELEFTKQSHIVPLNFDELHKNSFVSFERALVGNSEEKQLFMEMSDPVGIGGS